MDGIWQSIINWDRSTFLALNHGMGCRPLDRIMPWVTNLGLGHVQALLVIVAALIVGWRMRNLSAQKAWAAPAMFAIIIGGLSADVLKLTPNGMRPWWFSVNEHAAGRNLDFEPRTVEGVYALKVYRFPSGHTATSFAILTALIPALPRSRKKKWVLVGVIAIALSIALSRIYLASHWPLDILGGALIGSISGFLSYQACRAYAAWRSPRGISILQEESAEAPA